MAYGPVLLQGGRVMSSPRVPSVRLDDGRYVLPDAVCLWFFRVFEACKDEVFGCRKLRVLQYRVEDEPQDYRAQVEEHTAHGHAVVRVELVAGFEREEDVPTFDDLRDTAMHEALHLLFSDYSRLALHDRRSRDDKWNDVLKAEHEIMNVLMQLFDRGMKFDVPFPPDRDGTARLERHMYRVRSIALKDVGND